MRATTQSGPGLRSAAELKPAGSELVGSKMANAPQKSASLKAGTISFGGGAITCTVRNLSATGAMLDVTSPVGIPARFTLVIEAEHASKPAVVVRRQDKRIGIRFEVERASSAV